jgi:hypothetical protein
LNPKGTCGSGMPDILNAGAIFLVAAVCLAAVLGGVDQMRDGSGQAIPEGTGATGEAGLSDATQETAQAVLDLDDESAAKHPGQGKRDRDDDHRGHGHEEEGKEKDDADEDDGD